MAEIKISELSIGDWVKASGDVKRVHSIEYQNGEYFVHFSDPDTNSEDYLHAPFVRPIPLTPEILEKNGFEELKDKFWVGHNHHCRIQQHGSCWTLLSNKRGFYRTIRFEGLEFVHQLQHALRLAGVEKEIEV